MKIPDSDIELLVTLYGMPHYQALKRLMEQRQLDHAQQAPFAADMNRVSELKGRITELKDLDIEMRKINDKQGDTHGKAKPKG